MEKHLPRTVLPAVQPYLAGQTSNSLSAFLPLLPARTIFSAWNLSGSTHPTRPRQKRCLGDAPSHPSGKSPSPASMQATKVVAPQFERCPWFVFAAWVCQDTVLGGLLVGSEPLVSISRTLASLTEAGPFVPVRSPSLFEDSSGWPVCDLDTVS